LYSFGLLNVKFHELSDEVKESLIYNFDRISNNLNEQEVCSTLYGIGKMETKWSKVSDHLRALILNSISNLSVYGSLCLGCSIYSLGLMEVDWYSLPENLVKSFYNLAIEKQLKDQTMSNVVYGLSAMQANWFTLDSNLRKLIIFKTINNKKGTNSGTLSVRI
jgi:hypothetical protein